MFDSGSIAVPTLLINETVCRSNIEFMQGKADKSGVQLIPHFKTHQSAVVGSWFRDAGTKAITVSSLSMATFFAGHGWDDITVAFPANIRESDTIKALAASVRLRIFILSAETAAHLANVLTHPVEYYIEIDTGYHRTGVPYDDHMLIGSVIRAASESGMLKFAGFYTHDGNTYDVRGRDAIMNIHRGTREKLEALRAKYAPAHPGLRISMGDTPGCSVAGDFAGLDEIRPGNYVYYDVTQTLIGSCNYDQIGTVLAAPIVARHEERLELVIYGGGVHLSKDSVTINGKTIYGLPVDLLKNGWSAPAEGCYIRKLSQEHGILKVTRAVFDRYKVGDVIGILPVHSCMTMDLMRFNGSIMIVT
ncbi:MAG: alanine racemase [Rhodothermaceae bacterium]|nr:alanine racemase [Rhodothermaceae bacterium]